MVETRGQRYLVRDKDFTIERGKGETFRPKSWFRERITDKLNRIEGREKKKNCWNIINIEISNYRCLSITIIIFFLNFYKSQSIFDLEITLIAISNPKAYFFLNCHLHNIRNNWHYIMINFLFKQDAFERWTSGATHRSQVKNKTCQEWKTASPSDDGHDVTGVPNTVVGS